MSRSDEAARRSSARSRRRPREIHGGGGLNRHTKRLVKAVPGIRRLLVYGLSLGRKPHSSSNWIRFVMYHDIRAGDRAGLDGQLRYMRSFGDFISVDSAVALLHSGGPIDGRYLCTTFDDGYKGCSDHALPILAELGIPAAFFVVPRFIEPPADRCNDNRRRGANYLSWSDCRALVAAGMTIGSHTLSHARLSRLDDMAVVDELGAAKALIEERTGRPCRHFACPWGQPYDDFQPDRDPLIAEKVGYSSFFTTVRGKAVRGLSPFFLPREKVEPGWGNYQIRYFFSL